MSSTGSDKKKDSRDWWEKTEIIGKLLSALIIPFALLIVGNLINTAVAEREQRQQEIDRAADEERRRIDRAHALLDGLASDSERRRRLTISWAKYLDTVKQLPSASAAVLIEVAASDSSRPVAQAAASVAAEAAAGSAALREVARDRLKTEGAEAIKQLPELATVLATELFSTEGIVTVPPCRPANFRVFGANNCDRSTAMSVDVCSAPFPKDASIRSTRVFTKWSGEARQWEDAQARLNADGEWNGFGAPEVRASGDRQQVCVPFLQWSSHRARDARIEVTYSR